MTRPVDQAVAVDPPEHWRRHVIRQVGILLLLAALVGLGYLLQDAWKLLGPPERCWEFREIDGKLYRVNPCNGRIQLIGDVAPPDPAP